MRNGSEAIHVHVRPFTSFIDVDKSHLPPSPASPSMRKSILSLLFVGFVALNAFAIERERPNVVLIITDDQGYGDVSVHGNPILQTPAMDRLHAESVRLTDYHVSPTCAPTRGAMMSGHYTNRAGPWHTIMGRSFLRVGELTLGEVFSTQGYGTGLFGKWHLGDNYPYRPEDRGFTETVVHAGGGVGQTPDYWDNAYFDDVYRHNGEPKQFYGYCTDVYFKEARRFMAQEHAADRPFFAVISTNAPHSPFHAPDKYWKPYLAKGLDEREALFFGMIANIDENLDALRRWLDAEGLAENTIVIFTTDNGTASGENVFNGGMRGKKNSEYDGGHRVPFFMHWPAGGMDEGKDVTRLTAHIDVLPTLIELCGLEAPVDYEFDGRSIVPLLEDDADDWPDRVIITDSQRVVDPIKWRKSATMTDRWRLVNGTELFDMQADPGQQQDVAGQHPEVVADLRSAYDAWWADISPSFAIDERIVVGHPAENSTMLTAHDWLNDDNGMPPWHQSSIRDAKPSMGWWAVRVAESGKYRVSLRRWPSEVNLPLQAELAPGAPAPGLKAFRETPGRALMVIGARLEISDQAWTQTVSAGDMAAVFEVELEAGEHTLKGVFETETEDRAEIGSFYAVVERL